MLTLALASAGLLSVGNRANEMLTLALAISGANEMLTLALAISSGLLSVENSCKPKVFFSQIYDSPCEQL